MKSQKFEIRHEQHVNRARAILDNLDLSKEWSFSIKPYRRNRSLEQQARYWVLLNKWERKTGQPANDIHEMLKEKILIPMLRAESESFQIEVEAVRELRRRGQGKMADFWKARMTTNASTTDLNTEQHSRYSARAEEEAAEFGVVLEPNEE